jgi:hypothetical protein
MMHIQYIFVLSIHHLKPYDIMKALSHSQIATIKTIQHWNSTGLIHGNTKYYRGLPVSLFRDIVEKKRTREMLKDSNFSNLRPLERIRIMLRQSLSNKGTSYHKVLIMGNTGIYYASPVYGHSDYNKIRVMDANPRNIRIMELFNNIVGYKPQTSI